MRKGFLEYFILIILKKQPSYASDIIEALKDAKMIVVEGTLYPLLTRLKNADVLDYQWEESSLGPPRKYYELTQKGHLLLEEMEQSWNDLNSVIEQLKTKN